MAELSNCEQSVNNDKSVSNEICRLRYGLNENCLLHVFEYLREFDLITLCKMDVYYKELILKWIIKQKLVNLKRLENQTEILNVFGKSMRKFKIYTGNFKEMLALIVKYCEPGELTEIDMEINDSNDSTDLLLPYEVAHLTKLATPFFSNLRKLRFETYKSTDHNDAFNNFLTQISTTATNLQSLELVTLAPRLNWLQNMRNLVELRFLWRNGSSFDNLISYLETCPKLKVFEFRHKLPNLTSICNALTESCSEHLRVFSDIDESMSTSDHHHHNLDKSLIERYAFLSKFSHLSDVTLMTYTFCGSDLYYALMSLAKKDIVKLKIVTAYSRNIILSDEVKENIMRRRLPQFARLNSVEIEIREPNVPVFDSKWTQCDLRCQFMFHFLRQVNSLQQFTFNGSSLTNMDKVLEHVPHIRLLDLSKVSSLQTLRVVSNILEILRKRRQLADGENEHGIFQLILRDSFDVRNFVKYIDSKDAMINFTLRTLRSWD